MRITNKMMASQMLATITSNRELAAKLQMDIASTKKVRRPSDDPNGVMQLGRLNSLVSRNEQYIKNIKLIGDFMTNSASVIDSAIEQLESAKDIASRGSSGTMSTAARKSLATQVDQIIDLMVDFGNTRYKNRFLFGGTLTTGTKPYTRSGDTITYNGNAKGMQGQIGFQTEITYNKTGDEVFAPSGGTDIFAELVALKQGLEADDDNAILNTVSTLSSAIDEMISLSAEFGILQDRLTSTEAFIENENIHFADTISTIQDTDVVEALVNSQLLRNAVNSGLKTMADIVQRSLVDFVS